MEGKQALTSLKMIKSVMLLNGEKERSIILKESSKNVHNKTNSGRKPVCLVSKVDGMPTMCIEDQLSFSVVK